jgi:hypothetical protein
MAIPSKTSGFGEAVPTPETGRFPSAPGSSPPFEFDLGDEAQSPEPAERGAVDRGTTGGALGSGLKETARTAADAFLQQASQFAGDVGHELTRTGEAQKARGVEAIRNLARAIDSAADELQGQSPLVASTVHEAARGVEGLSDSLSNRNVNELVDSAVRLARAQPVLFLGGSVAAGFALARFLMSGSRDRAAGFDPYQS